VPLQRKVEERLLAVDTSELMLDKKKNSEGKQ
jgi:hypothetical protein